MLAKEHNRDGAESEYHLKSTIEAYNQCINQNKY